MGYFAVGETGEAGGAVGVPKIKTVFTVGFITPAAPSINFWYLLGHDKGLSDNNNLSLTLGNGATPTLANFTLGYVVPAAGTVTKVKFWLRAGASAAAPGVIEIWKGSKTSGAAAYAATKLGTTITLPAVTFGPDYAANATFTSANTVAEGDTIYGVWRQGADSLSNCRVSGSILFEEA